MSDKTPISVKPWEVARTAWWGISEDSIRNKIIEVSLREENNLIHLNDNDELYTDLQLESWITPSDDLPVWVETWRVLVADGRPVTWTLVLAKTTSWDEIKILYGDDGEIMVDNGTGTWKNVTTAYFKTQAEYDSLPARKNTDGNLYIIVDTHVHLMSYEEIIALTCDNAVTELNSAATEYYDKFRREWHLFGDCLSDDGTALRERNEPSSLGVLPYIEYSNWTWRKRYSDI